MNIYISYKFCTYELKSKCICHKFTFTCTATINFMAVRESYATWKATKETDAFDAKTFEVRAVPDVALEGLRPGMSVIVKQNK